MNLRRKRSSSERSQCATTREGIHSQARTLLAEPHSPGTEKTWETLKAKFPTEEISYIAAAVTAVAVSALEGEG